MVSLIIISYNSHRTLEKCLGALIQATKYPVIIIDNASPDGSGKLLETQFPNAVVKTLPQNQGYGRAANIALEMVSTPYALLLNPDLMATGGQIDQLLRRAQSDTNKTAIWAPATLEKDHGKASANEVEWVSGCAMLFEMEKLMEIGLFDENIFLFFEETELCTRTIQAGFGIQLHGDIHFQHLQGQACNPSPEIEALKAWHFGWSRCYYHNKYHPDNKQRSPERQYRQYRRKSLMTFSRQKHAAYLNKSKGVKAFMNGEKAFRENGKPQFGDLLM